MYSSVSLLIRQSAIVNDTTLVTRGRALVNTFDSSDHPLWTAEVVGLTAIYKLSNFSISTSRSTWPIFELDLNIILHWKQVNLPNLPYRMYNILLRFKIKGHLLSYNCQQGQTSLQLAGISRLHELWPICTHLWSLSFFFCPVTRHVHDKLLLAFTTTS